MCDLWWCCCVPLLRLSAVFHVVDQDGNKLYDGQVIDRIEQVKCMQSSLSLGILDWLFNASQEQNESICSFDDLVPCFSLWERDR